MTRSGLLTDGRFSGGTHGLMIGHVAPEAAHGGPIAFVREGDMITIDVDKRVLDLEVDAAEIERRKVGWTPPRAALHPGRDGQVRGLGLVGQQGRRHRPRPVAGPRVDAVLEPGQRALLDEARRATLATIGPDGRPRLVPCCFALDRGRRWPWWSTRPSTTSPSARAIRRSLARVRDIERDPRVTLLVDRWDEDWTRLAWLRLDGIARLISPEDERRRA